MISWTMQPVVSWQLGRPARPFRRVAVRCVAWLSCGHGAAAVGPDGAPFPTTYYLTCPWLVAALARSEAGGGVKRWTEAAASDSRLGESLARANAEQRELRPELDAGIAGTRNGALKCLHAHAAFALARPGYELGERDPRRGRRALVPRRPLCRGVRGRRSWRSTTSAISGTTDGGGSRRPGRERRAPGTSSLLVDAVVDELRRRVGQTYTLTELAGAYRGSEEWVRDVVLRETPPKARAGVRDTALVQDAAFALYAHGATDYRP